MLISFSQTSDFWIMDNKKLRNELCHGIISGSFEVCITYHIIQDAGPVELSIEMSHGELTGLTTLERNSHSFIHYNAQHSHGGIN